MKSTSTIDSKRLLHDVDAVRISRGVTWYRVWRETYITNFSHIRRGLMPLSRANAQTLAQWAGLDLAVYKQEVTV